MTGLDTNVIIRYLVNDNHQQAQAARKLFTQFTADHPGFICREVIVELTWVLDKAYGFSRDQIATVLENLATTAELRVEAADDVIRAAHGYRRGGAEFSDRMIAAAAIRSGNGTLYTFDKQAAQLTGSVLLVAT